MYALFHLSVATATTIDPAAAERTLAEADLVVEGDVVSTTEDVSPEGLPITYYRVAVADTLKGTAEETVDLKVPGGWIEDHTYVHVHGRPLLGVGDRVLVAMTESFADGTGTGRLTTFGLYIAIEDRSWGGAPLALDASRRPLMDYSSSQPRVASFEDVDLGSLATECDPASELADTEVLTWDSVKLAWAAQLENAMWDPEFRPGVHFSNAGGAQ